MNELENLKSYNDYLTSMNHDIQENIIMDMAPSLDLKEYYESQNKLFNEYLIKIEEAKKEINEYEKQLKEILLQVCEGLDIKKIENDDFRINYIDKTSRETFDSKTFRKDYPDLYDKYISISSISPQIKVTLKSKSE